MAQVRVQHDRLTRYSSMLMILLGVFTLFFVSGFFGIVIIIVGLVMWRYYRRQTKQALKPPKDDSPKGAVP